MFSTCDFLENNSKEKNTITEAIRESADFIKSRIRKTPEIAIICGSGLGTLSELLVDPIVIPYETIPNFPKCTVEGHEGKLVFGKLVNIPVLCFNGRFHMYEGYPLWKCTLPIRVVKEVGEIFLIISNAAGGLNSKFKCGDIMLIEDHIDLVRLFGNFSLRGTEEQPFHFGYRPTNIIYNREIVNECMKIGVQIGFDGKIHKGIYTFAMGPNYETIADVNFLKIIGSDAVGSSTVHEAIVAKSLGIEVMAFSLITNISTSSYDNDNDVNHEEVLHTAKNSEKFLQKFMETVVEFIKNYNNNNRRL